MQAELLAETGQQLVGDSGAHQVRRRTCFHVGWQYVSFSCLNDPTTNGYALPDV